MSITAGSGGSVTCSTAPSLAGETLLLLKLTPKFPLASQGAGFPPSAHFSSEILLGSGEEAGLCLYMYMHTYTHVCIGMEMHVCVYAYVCTSICMYYMFLYLCMYIRMCMCMNVHVYLYMFIYVYASVHKYTLP